LVVRCLSRLRRKEGRINRLHSRAIKRVNEIRYPTAEVPPNEEKMKIAKPQNNTLEE